MTESAVKDQPLRSNRILLAAADTGAQDYLTTIFEFIDCEVVSTADDEALLNAIKDPCDRPVSLFVSPGVGKEFRQLVLDTAVQTDPRPALFQIQTKDDDEIMLSGDVLGTLRLPTHFDAVTTLLHKSSTRTSVTARAYDDP